MSQQEILTVKKPALLRVIFILNALLVIAGFVFFVVFSNKAANGESTFGIPPQRLLYMALIYTAMFGGVVFSILKKNIWMVRLFLAITLISSLIIVFAPIGLIIAAISIALSFTKPVLHYFSAQ